jgi:hypothetical protein
LQFFFIKALCQTLSKAFDISQNTIIDDNLQLPVVAYHHLSCEFAPHSWIGVLDKTLCDKVGQ